jgi:YidC/Oxa1 family membrane protein insertase
MLVFANILQPLIDIADAILNVFHDELSFGWGMSIVAMTVVVRLAILPLTIKGVKSMNALRELQPQMKEIQEKYKNDRQRQQQEMMKFYRENQINPLGSCLPLLLQIPVFLALFFLLNGDEFKDQLTPASQGWLFIDNLAEPATGGALAVLMILYVVSQLASSLVMLSTATDRTQRMLFLLLPFAIIPFAINFPAGLLVYWVTTNVWTFGQQLVVRKVAPPPQLAPVAGGSGARVPKPAKGAKGEAVTVPPQKKPPPPPRKKKRRRR